MGIVPYPTAEHTRPRFSGTLYPDRTFSIGAIPKPKKLEADKKYDQDYESQFDSYVVREDYKGRSLYVERKFFTGTDDLNRFINTPESSQELRNYGSKGITAYGKKCVSNIAYLLQEQFSRSRLGFGTATLPSLTREGLESCLSNFGEIVRRFFQEIRRVFTKRGVKFLYVGVVEIQPRRFAKTGCPYPHLHWIYVAKSGKFSPWHISANLLRTLWRRVVVSILSVEAFKGEASQKDFRASIDTSTVRKSASGYLAKYMSKGSSTVESMQEAGFESFPKQWWTASVEAKKMFRDSLIKLDSKTCESFFYQLECYLDEGSVVWASFVVIELSGIERTIGLVGALSKDAYALLL